jgi:hypothetical protein
LSLRLARSSPPAARDAAPNPQPMSPRQLLSNMAFAIINL